MVAIAGAAIMGGAALAGGLMQLYGAKKAGKIQKAALAQSNAFRERALAKLEALGIPSVEAQEIVLNRPELVFEYVPELEAEIDLPESAYAEIGVDPMLMETQSGLLETYKDQSEQGLLSGDQALLNQIRRGVAGEVQAKDASILQSMERRGMGGSGMELAQRLQSGQASQQQAAEASDRKAVMMQEAKQAGLSSMGVLAGQMRQQDWNEKADKATKMDAWSKFKAGLASGTAQRNTAATNAGNLTSAQMAQQHEYNLSNIGNEEERYNKGLIGSNYNKEFDLARSQSDTLTGNATSAASQGATAATNELNKYKAGSEMIGGLAKAGASAYEPQKKTATKSVVPEEEVDYEKKKREQGYLNR